jgi:Xaa-Pro aminopeptidase
VDLGKGRVGHGMGLMSTEPPHVALYEETVCEEGLAFTIEPRITNQNGVFNCEELLVVTKTGVEVLTTSPRNITYIN